MRQRSHRMPGYKALPDEMSGHAARRARHAEAWQRAGEHEEAVRALEDALETCIASSPELPGWLCGRLAALYRTLKRHGDEVHLLERYRDSQRTDEGRSRFDARLSKAHALAARDRRTETRALSSVSGIAHRKASKATLETLDLRRDYGFEDDTIHALRGYFLTSRSPDAAPSRQPLARLSLEARLSKRPPEQMVSAIRQVWRSIPCAPGTEDAWTTAYRVAVTHSLELYFGEQDGR